MGKKRGMTVNLLDEIRRQTGGLLVMEPRLSDFKRFGTPF